MVAIRKGETVTHNHLLEAAVIILLVHNGQSPRRSYNMFLFRRCDNVLQLAGISGRTMGDLVDHIAGDEVDRLRDLQT